MSDPESPQSGQTAEEQVKSGIILSGKYVRFIHQPKGPSHRVVAVHSDGMVEIDGFSGQFAPHLFILYET